MEYRKALRRFPLHPSAYPMPMPQEYSPQGGKKYVRFRGISVVRESEPGMMQTNRKPQE